MTEPLKFSSLWPKDDPSRPRPSFHADLRGPEGIERIRARPGLAAPGPAHRRDPRRPPQRGRSCQVDSALFERALDEAIVRGHNVLYELMRGECRLPGEWEYLSTYRKQETQPPPDEAMARSLRRRLLVAEEGDAGPWRLRVPLMRRWLIKRG